MYTKGVVVAHSVTPLPERWVCINQGDKSHPSEDQFYIFTNSLRRKTAARAALSAKWQLSHGLSWIKPRKSASNLGLFLPHFWGEFRVGSNSLHIDSKGFPFIYFIQTIFPLQFGRPNKLMEVDLGIGHNGMTPACLLSRKLSCKTYWSSVPQRKWFPSE